RGFDIPESGTRGEEHATCRRGRRTDGESGLTIRGGAQFLHRIEPLLLDVNERFERREVVLNLCLETLQHACGEFMTLALFADLRHPEAQSHADHDERSFKQPMAEGLSDFRNVRVHFHARMLPNRWSPLSHGKSPR